MYLMDVDFFAFFSILNDGSLTFESFILVLFNL